MMSDKKVIKYMINDPVNLIESELGNYREEYLKNAHDNGLVFIAVGENGERWMVPWDEVKDPQPEAYSYKIPIISHKLFMDVLEPIVEAIENLESTQKGTPIATLSAKNEKAVSKVRAAYDAAVELFKKDFPEEFEGED